MIVIIHLCHSSTQSGGGTLNFVDRQRFAYIDISVLDNGIPELSKTFQVELSNPTGGGECRFILFRAVAIFFACERSDFALE